MYSPRLVPMLVRALSIVGGFLLFVLVPASASAATLYWVGNDLAATSTASNWKTTDPTTCGSGDAGAAPGSADTIIFDADCDNGATVDSTLSVTTITVSSGYAGTILLKAALSTSTFSQADGTIRLNGQAYTVTSTFTISGGTFMAGTGSVVLSGGSATIDINGTQTLYDVTINSSGTKTIAASDSLSMSGTLTLTDGLVSQSTIPSAGTLRAKGNVIQASTFDGGTARLVVDGSSSQTFVGNATRTAGLLPLLVINKATGGLTLSGTIRTANNWGYSGGTLNFLNSTVVFAGASLVISGSHNLSSVTFDSNSASNFTYTVKAGTTLTVLGTLTFDNSSTGIFTINTGIISAKGDIVQADTILHAGSANLFINGTGSQLFAGRASKSAGSILDITIDKSGGGTLTLSGTIRTGHNWNFSGGTLNPDSSTLVLGKPSITTIRLTGSHSLYNLTFDTNDASQRQFTITSTTTITVLNDLTLDNTGAGSFGIQAGTISVKGNVYNRDAINHSGSATIAFTGTGNQLFSGVGTAKLGGMPKVLINKSSGTLTLSGSIRGGWDWTYRSGTIDASTNQSTVVFAGSTNNGTDLQTISGSMTLYNVVFTGAFVHTISSGSTITAANLLTLSDGSIRTGTASTLNDLSYASYFDGGNGGVTIDGSATRTIALTASGALPNMKITAPNVTVTTPSSSIVTIEGDFRQTAGTVTGGAGQLFVLGNFSLAGGTFTAPGTLNVGGSFIYEGGTFTPNGGTVLLSGVYGTVTPPPSFYNLTLQDDHLIGYWKLDETSGTTVDDASANNRNGTWSGAAGTATPQWTTSSGLGQLTNTGALQFDGTDDVVAFGNFSRIRSASLWFKLPTWDNVETLLAWDLVEFLLQIDTGTALSYFNGSGMFPSASVSTVSTGTWHHIALTYDGIFARLFLDGTEISTLRKIPDFASYALQLSYSTTQFHGIMDDVRVYDRVLSSREVAGIADNFDKRHVLAGDLSVDNVFTMNTAVLDRSNNCYDVDYGLLTNTGGLILTCPVSSSSSSSAASTTGRSGGGGGGGRRTIPPTMASSSSVRSSQGASTPSCNDAGFLDVPATAWFACFVDAVFNARIIKGYMDAQGNPLHLFGPANPITYTELAKIALLGSGNDLPTSSDIPKNIAARNTWAAPFITLAEELHFSIFTPSLEVHKPASRGAVVLTMLQAFRIPLQKNLPNTFVDLPPSDPYKDAILTAEKLGWISGDTDANGSRRGTVRPQDSINRAEVVKILTKARGGVKRVIE